MSTDIHQLWELLQTENESKTLEAKRGNQIGYSVMQTVNAFANEPGQGGGWIILGVEEVERENKKVYIPRGIDDQDKLLNELQSNCRSQFDHPIHVDSVVGTVEGKLLLGIYIHELDPANKPCSFICKLGKNDKVRAKTGVWRRGLNGDYECSQKELQLFFRLQEGTKYEQRVMPEATWDDLDSTAIEKYRQLRARVKPHAEELKESDEEMLYALHMVRKDGRNYLPTLAGILMFGKTLALRRLLPAARVDYVRVPGTTWVEDTTQRFETTQDFREPLIRMIPKLEAAIMDDLPRKFNLPEGVIQREDTSLLPQKVVREAVVNAIMHRDYSIDQPVLIVRFNDRIELRNAGYSLKPENELGEKGSVLRNPFIASVLYDLDFAETKGTGIRLMRNLLAEAGMDQPIFRSSLDSNQFEAIYLLHQLMDEEQLSWLAQFNQLNLDDNERKALVYAREYGAVDNAYLRSICNLDTLFVSRLLRKLCDIGLLKKTGAGKARAYRLTANAGGSHISAGGSHISAGGSHISAGGSHISAGGSHISAGGSHINPSSDLSKSQLMDTFSSSIQKKVLSLPKRLKKDKMEDLILDICTYRACTTEELSEILDRSAGSIKNQYISPMIKRKLLGYKYPEVIHHPDQAYIKL